MKSDKRPLLLVFGTSADPIHAGHVRLVTGAVRALQARGEQVAEVMIMPVFRHHNLRMRPSDPSRLLLTTVLTSVSWQPMRSKENWDSKA